MGASVFKNRVARVSALDLADAFRVEAASARYEYGHGGYTGTIAEKYEVKLARQAAPCASFEAAEAEADRLLESVLREDGVLYSDKWGPCWAIEVPGAEGGWLFFGVAAE